jgi:hypothetical protein
MRIHILIYTTLGLNFEKIRQVMYALRDDNELSQVRMQMYTCVYICISIMYFDKQNCGFMKI